MRIEAVNALGDHLGPALAVALRFETLASHAVLHEIVDHRLRASLAESVVILVAAHAVGVGREFYGHIGILLEGLHHLVESLFRGGAQRCLVEVVEDILNDLRLHHGRQHEVDIVLGIGLLKVALELLLGIQVACRAGQHHILHAALQVEAEAAVGFGGRLLVAAVVAHDANHGIGHGFLVLVEHIARNPHLEFRFLETVNLVIAARVLAVGAEEARLTLAEGDAEVVGRRVHGRAHVHDEPLVRGLQGGLEQVQTAKARMAVAREIEHTVGAAVGEALVAGGVDLATEVLQRAHALLDVDAPQVQAAVATGHIAREVEPIAVGAHRGVAVGRERVGGDVELVGGAPLSLGARRGVNFNRRGAIGFANDLGEIHGGAIGAEGGHTLVPLGIELAFGRFGARPLALLVLFGEEDVAALGAGDFALGGAGGFLGRRGKENLVAVGAEELRAEVGSARVEHLVEFHVVARALLLPSRSHVAGANALLRHIVVRHIAQIALIVLLRLFPLAVHVLSLSQIEIDGAVLILIAQCVLERSLGTRTLIQSAVALAHLEGHLTT